VLKKPAEIVDRDKEWQVLSEFVRPSPPDMAGTSIAAVTGRRRAGKTFLLRQFNRQVGGIYYEARQEDTLAEAQQRLRTEIASYEPSRAAEIGAIGLEAPDTWDRLLETAMDVTFARRSGDAVPPVIIDEFPYLLRDTPALPSILHQLYDTHMMPPDEIAPPGQRIGYFDRLVQGRLLLCGSAMSVMHELGHGSRPLFGRLAWTMTVTPFDHIDMARFWEIGDHEVAVLFHAAIGGAPGYRDPLRRLTGFGSPQNLDELDAWIIRAMLTPLPDFFTENEIWHLLREDPRAGDKVIYQQVMKAISEGATTPTQVGGKVRKSKEEIEPIIDRLVAMGYVDERSDLIPPGRLVLRLRDPVLRFHHAVVEPTMNILRDGEVDPRVVWVRSADRFRSQVLGPSFEEIVGAGARRMLRDRGVEIGSSGWTLVDDPENRRTHEVDFIGVAPYSSIAATGTQVTVIGEAKATQRLRGLKDLERLRHVRDLLSKRHDAAGAKLAIFSMYGFSDALRAEAAHDPAVLLFSLDDLFTRRDR
jgi:hypothetical protein